MTRPFALAGALAACLAVVPNAAAAEDLARPEPNPPSSVRPKILLGAAAIFGVGYGGAVIGGAAAPEWPGSEELYIPFAGPFLSLAKLACPTDPKTLLPTECDPGFLGLRAALVTFSAVSQLAGLGLAIQGIALRTDAPAPAKKPTAWVAPMPRVSVDPRGGFVVGAGLAGAF